jgi:hypothetical protein
MKYWLGIVGLGVLALLLDIPLWLTVAIFLWAAVSAIWERRRV